VQQRALLDLARAWPDLVRGRRPDIGPKQVASPESLFQPDEIVDMAKARALSARDAVGADEASPGRMNEALRRFAGHGPDKQQLLARLCRANFRHAPLV
jgi:hypothetical protein